MNNQEVTKVMAANLYVANMLRSKNKENISKAVKFIELNQKYFKIPQSTINDILVEHNITREYLDSMTPADLSGLD